MGRHTFAKTSPSDSIPEQNSTKSRSATGFLNIPNISPAIFDLVERSKSPPFMLTGINPQPVLQLGIKRYFSNVNFA